MPLSAPGHFGLRWDERLYPGLRVEAVPAESRAALIQAIGALGVEAEHFLGTLRTFLVPPATVPRSRHVGELFLWQLEASAARLRVCAEAFELATHAYLSALNEGLPDLRDGSRNSADDPWWSAPPDEVGDVSALDLCLRTCGFSYRQAVTAQVTPSVETLAEHLSLLLHALDTLPPAGILPVPALSAGLLELASTFQGHVVHHLLSDSTSDPSGLPAAIRRLRVLDASEDRSVEADLAWARAQLHEVRAIAEQAHLDERDSSSRRGGLAGLLRRDPARARRTPSSSRGAWSAAAEREWHETISALESIQG